GDPVRLVGGVGSVPARFYAASRTRRASRLFRSDDDGATWTEVLDVGSTLATAPVNDPNAPVVHITGLAYDPLHPDAVYVGLSLFPPGTTGSPEGEFMKD